MPLLPHILKYRAAERLKAHCAPFWVWNNEMRLADVWIGSYFLPPSLADSDRDGMKENWSQSCLDEHLWRRDAVMKRRQHWCWLRHHEGDDGCFPSQEEEASTRRGAKRLPACLLSWAQTLWLLPHPLECLLLNSQGSLSSNIISAIKQSHKHNWSSRLLEWHQGKLRAIQPFIVFTASTRLEQLKWRDTREYARGQFAPCSSPAAYWLDWLITLNAKWTGLTKCHHSAPTSINGLHLPKGDSQRKSVRGTTGFKGLLINKWSDP